MSHGLPALWPIVLAAAPALADPSPSRADLRFEVTLAVAGPPRDVRLIVVLGRSSRPEPRRLLGRTGLDSAPAIARDVDGFREGAKVSLDASCATFPIEGLNALPAGTYFAQAVLKTSRDLNLTNAPGDLYGPPVKVEIDPAKGGAISLEINSELPADALPAETDEVKFVRLESKLLSAFHKRPIFLRAGVILPRGFDEDRDRKYPLRVHVGGYGQRYDGVLASMRDGSSFRRVRDDEDAPKMLFLMLDGAGPLGDPYQVNSANNGPFGDAIVKELIPYVEAKFRGIGGGKARVIDGGSTGGWVSLALQVFYPDEFNGCWSSCPDGVDFRGFQLVDIYRDKNAYINADGFERPGARTVLGDVRYTMRHELQMENLLGRGDSWAMSGGQWGAWNATYGPRGDDGKPVPLWDPKSGTIDPKAAEHWKAYDLRMILERDWKTLGPKLRGKIHVFVGEADDFFLNNAVHRLDDFLKTADPKFEGVIRYGPGQGHCWSPLDEPELMRQMAERLRGRN